MSTKPKICVGTDNFADLLLSSNIFVDKSMFIQEFLEESGSKAVLIVRPRRWGKSLNMDMLRCFLTIEVDEQGGLLPQEESLNHKLFAGGEVVIGPKTGKVKQLAPLKIAQQHPDLVSEYQGQYPVISLGLKDVKGSSYERIEAGLKRQIAKLYKKHRYLKQYIHPQSNLLDEDQKEQLSRYFKSTFSQEDLADSLRFLSELLYKHFGKPVYILIDEYDAPINHAYLAFKDSP
ncbi:MAG: AAA family ATPase, partial [Bacteroidota bacterium]